MKKILIFGLAWAVAVIAFGTGTAVGCQCMVESEDDEWCRDYECEVEDPNASPLRYKESTFRQWWYDCEDTEEDLECVETTDPSFVCASGFKYSNSSCTTLVGGFTVYMTDELADPSESDDCA